MMAGIPQLPHSGDRMLGSRLASSFALYTALRSLEAYDTLDVLTLAMLEESIMAYAKACGFKAEA